MTEACALCGAHKAHRRDQDPRQLWLWPEMQPQAKDQSNVIQFPGTDAKRRLASALLDAMACSFDAKRDDLLRTNLKGPWALGRRELAIRRIWALVASAQTHSYAIAHVAKKDPRTVQRDLRYVAQWVQSNAVLENYTDRLLDAFDTLFTLAREADDILDEAVLEQRANAALGGALAK